MNINIFLFGGFESLDIFGPVEILGRIDEYNLHYYSVKGGLIKSAQNTVVLTERICEAVSESIFIIPGGRGTRRLVNDESALNVIRKCAVESKYCLSICTGSAVLAKCTVLDGIRATSNKRAWDWAISNSDKVNWIRKARWCADGKFYTSSGVSAGIDMTLGFISDRYGEKKAKEIADSIEYIWNGNPDNDPFCT